MKDSANRQPAPEQLTPAAGGRGSGAVGTRLRHGRADFAEPHFLAAGYAG